VQSLIAQGSQFPLRKPAGFHYDFALLGLTTFLAGLLGIPAPNGLIPQAPIHTRALLVHGVVNQDEDALCDGDGIARLHEVPIGVVEQRASNLAQGSLCLVLLTTPFLHVLHLVPQGVPTDFPSFTLTLPKTTQYRRACGLVVCSVSACVLGTPADDCNSGHSWYMGLDELSGNGITQKVLYVLTDRTLTPHSQPLRRVRKSRILLFVAVQLVAFGVTFAITQTVGTSLQFVDLSACLGSQLIRRFCVSCGRISYHHPVTRSSTDFSSLSLTILR
jgi:boron transporter